MTDAEQREFDLVLVGATGFVGRLTAAELGRVAPPDLRIGLAGRSASKLHTVATELGHPASSWPALVVDLRDPVSVRDLVERTRVVVTTAGPYAAHGQLLIEACARAGTHYADLTGETLFVRDAVARCHALAQETGARIVPSCGFDSVPSDLGVGLTARHARQETDGDRLTRAVLHVRSARGGISGGTIDSLRQQIVAAQADRDEAKVLADPEALTGVASAAGRRQSGPPVVRDPRTGRWHAPFVMGGYNRQIVWRTNALTDFSYGRDFDYREVVDTGPGLGGAAGAGVVTVGTNLLLGGMWFPPTRWLLDRVLPEPGAGPSAAALQRGRFLVEVVGETANGRSYRTRFGADLDPGYRGTAVMLVQCGLALAEEDASSGPGGVLTTMVAFGPSLADRLRARGFTIETDELT